VDQFLKQLLYRARCASSPFLRSCSASAARR
jgi:hypothetical protein